MNDVIILSDFFADLTDAHQRCLGPYSVASSLRNRGLKVCVLDFAFTLSDDDFTYAFNKLVSKETRILGISETFIHSQQNYLTVDRFSNRFNLILSTARSINPEIKIIQGGAASYFRHVSSNNLFSGQNAEESYLTYFGETFQNLNSNFKFSDESFQFLPEDVILPFESLPLELSRGCAFNCKFCGFYGRGSKGTENYKKEDLIQAQFESNYRNFQTKNYVLSDDTFNESDEKMMMLERAASKSNLDLSFVCYARLDLIATNLNNLELMVRAGVKAIVFGIETLSLKAGKIIGKGMGKDRIEATLEQIRNRYPHLYLSSGFIAGLPEESLGEVEETYQWLISKKYLDSWNFNTLSIDNNSSDPHRSEFSKNIEKFGYERVGLQGWKRDNLISTEVKRFVDQLNVESARYSGPSPWALFSRLDTFEFDFLRKLKANQFHQLKTGKRDRYFQLLSNRLEIK
jgi:radical SAM superfamily enzyme YgiQ (UPF0313 family)